MSATILEAENVRLSVQKPCLQEDRTACTALAVVPVVQSLHNSEVQPASLLSADEQKLLISRLREIVRQIKVSSIKAGEILTELRDGTPYGDWDRRLQTICKDLNISRRTAYNYMMAFAETQFIPVELRAACDSASLSLEKPANRSAVLQELTADPNASPEDIVRSILEARKPVAPVQGVHYVPIELKIADALDGFFQKIIRRYSLASSAKAYELVAEICRAELKAQAKEARAVEDNSDWIDFAPEYLSADKQNEVLNFINAQPLKPETGTCHSEPTHDSIQWGPRQAYLACIPDEFRVASSGPIPNELTALHDEIQQRYQAAFNTIQVNRHWNERSVVLPHSDNMHGDIVMLSLGEPRRFVLRYKHDHKAKTPKWKAGDVYFDKVLPSGSLLTIYKQHQFDLTYILKHCWRTSTRMNVGGL